MKIPTTRVEVGATLNAAVEEGQQATVVQRPGLSSRKPGCGMSMCRELKRSPIPEAEGTEGGQ